MSSAPPSKRLYLGRLPPGIQREDIEDFFKLSESAKVTDVRINGHFGFVEYDNIQDAEDAVRDLNGRELKGERITIEFARSNRGPDRESYGAPRGGGYDAPPRARNPPAPRGHRIDVVGFGPGTSWQDLKDFARSAGSSVSYADVSRSRADEGVIEYQDYRDVEQAFRKLDGTDLNGSRVKLYEQRPPPRRRSPSPPPRRRSPSPRRRDYDDRDRDYDKGRDSRRRSLSPRGRDRD